MRTWRLLIPLVSVIVLGASVNERATAVWQSAQRRLDEATAHPVSFAVVCVVAVVGTLVAQTVGRRRWWRRRTLVRARIDACDPQALGVKRSLFADSHVAGPERPPYVSREVDAAIEERVREGGVGPLARLIMIVGPELSGKSRTAFENVERLLPNAFVIVPRPRRLSEQETALAQILRSRRRLGRAECHVLWLDDLGVALAGGDVTIDDVTAWLARHPDAVAVATVDSEHDVDLSGMDPTPADLEEPPQPLVLELELVGRELTDARRLYPWLGDACRFLPRELVARHPLIALYMQKRPAHPVGAAIVQAAVDCVRCRPGFPVPTRFLREHHERRNLARNSPPETFEEGLAWALKPLGDEGVALRQVGTDPDLHEVHPAFVKRADRENRRLADETWRTVRDMSSSDVDALLAIAEAANERGRRDTADEIARYVFAAFSDGRAMRYLLDDPARSAGQQVAPLASGSPAPRTRSESLPPARAAPSRNPFHLCPYAPHAQAAWLYNRPILRTLLRVGVLGLGDVVALVGVVALALACSTALFDAPDEGFAWSLEHFGAFAAAASIMTFTTVKLYTEDALRARLPAIVSAIMFVSVAAAIVGFVNGFYWVDYAFLAIATTLAIPAVYLLRRVYDELSCRWLDDKGLRSRTVLVGTPDEALVAGAMLERVSTRPLDLLGFVSDDEGPGHIGSVAELSHVIAKHTVQRVVLLDACLSPERQIEIADMCHQREVRVEVVPSTAELQLGIAAAHPHRTPGPIPVPPLTFSTGAAALKATFDFFVASLLLLLAAVPMLIIAVAIRIGSPGKPIVTFPRPGKEESPFGLKRFRTTDLPHEDVIRSEELGTPGGIKLTGFGRFLSRYRLDELPQLINVVWGDMSLVGPRPLPVGQHRRLETWQRKRYRVMPGLTGEWQLTLHKTSLEEMARSELAYIADWSLARDVAILLRTPTAIAQLAQREKRARPNADDVSTAEASA